MPKCYDPSKFSDRQVYAKKCRPRSDTSPLRFAILSASFWLIMSKNDPDQEWWLQFFLCSNLRKIRGVPSLKRLFFALEESRH